MLGVIGSTRRAFIGSAFFLGILAVALAVFAENLYRTEIGPAAVAMGATILLAGLHGRLQIPARTFVRATIAIYALVGALTLLVLFAGARAHHVLALAFLALLALLALVHCFVVLAFSRIARRVLEEAPILDVAPAIQGHGPPVVLTGQERALEAMDILGQRIRFTMVVVAWMPAVFGGILHHAASLGMGGLSGVVDGSWREMARFAYENLIDSLLLGIPGVYGFHLSPIRADHWTTMTLVALFRLALDLLVIKALLSLWRMRLAMWRAQGLPVG